MRREDFIYQYLLEYNNHEKKFGNNDAVSYWKDSDQTMGTSGLVFMVIRNALVHNTFETINELEKIGSLSEVLESLKTCKLQSDDRIKYMSILFNNEKVKSDLEKKKFDLINMNRDNIFKLFQRKDDVLYSSIFFSHTNLLFDTSISTYNQATASKEFYKGYYIETELFEDQYIFKFFKDDDSVIVHNVKIYVDRNFIAKKLYQSIDFIDINIITYGLEENIELKFNSTEIEKLDNDGIKKLLDTYASDSIIRDVAPMIKNAFKQLNNFLHVVGIQNDV